MRLVVYFEIGRPFWPMRHCFIEEGKKIFIQRIDLHLTLVLPKCATYGCSYFNTAFSLLQLLTRCAGESILNSREPETCTRPFFTKSSRIVRSAVTSAVVFSLSGKGLRSKKPSSITADAHSAAILSLGNSSELYMGIKRYFTFRPLIDIVFATKIGAIHGCKMHQLRN